MFCFFFFFVFFQDSDLDVGMVLEQVELIWLNIDLSAIGLLIYTYLS